MKKVPVPVYTINHWKDLIYQHKSLKALAAHLDVNQYALKIAIYKQTEKYFAQLYVDTLAEKNELQSFIYNLCQNTKGQSNNIGKITKALSAKVDYILPYLNTHYPLWEVYQHRKPIMENAEPPVKILMKLKRNKPTVEQPNAKMYYKGKYPIEPYSIETWKEFIYETKNLNSLASKLNRSPSSLAQVIVFQTGKRFGELFIDVLAEKNELKATLNDLWHNRAGKKFSVASAPYFGIHSKFLCAYLNSHYPDWKSWIQKDNISAEAKKRKIDLSPSYANNPSLMFANSHADFTRENKRYRKSSP